MNEKVDYSAYSDDELDQAIKDIQNVKLNRKKPYKQNIFPRLLSNSENESLSKNQNMIKTYIIESAIPYHGSEGPVGAVYITQNNSKYNNSFGYNFLTLDTEYSKKISSGYTDGIQNLISFSYNEN